MKYLAKFGVLSLLLSFAQVVHAAVGVGGSVSGGSGNGAFSFSFAFGSGGACAPGTVAQFACTILNIINGVLVPVLFAIAFIVFLYGVAKAYIFNADDEEAVKSGHKIILWGVIGFAVMISVWGLVNIVAHTFGLSGYGAPQYPTSYQ